jgi:tripartite-type tricarboxylate transporter receptor subunit TctC
MAVTNPMVLAVRPFLPARMVKDLVALIKAIRAVQLCFARDRDLGASPGRAIAPVAWPRSRARPFNGASLAVGSAVAGHTPICIAVPAPALPQIHDGKLHALAVMSKKRLQALPNVPTIAEAGFPGMEGENWFGVLVLAATPSAIRDIEFLSDATTGEVRIARTQSLEFTLLTEIILRFCEQYSQRSTAPNVCYRK